ncbi:MAG: DNA polymerase IV [Firmicutes bacterium HGW-Firmicutes-14]|nr:MAG: DNA polymerase IV [Firmicutes bacterium HGW-Firmicutes-14]
MGNILLADMNSFYASVHQAEDHSLRGRPVIVCGDPEKRHGIVLAASYEAKKFGVRTTMPRWEAERLVPNAVFLKPDHRKYLEFSSRIMNILRDFSPLVEPYSIDEAYIDISGCRLFGSGIETAKQIKKRIREEIGVQCSVGIGPNKLLAKMAAEMEKPDGLTVLALEDVPDKLWPLPVNQLFGVGAKTEKKLRFLGIRTIGDLAGYPEKVLQERFGKMGHHLHLSANGIGSSLVSSGSHHEVKSIGKQLTLSRDCQSEEIIPILIDLAEKVGYRVRQGGYMYRTITLILRDTGFINHTWSVSLADHTDITETIFSTSIRLLTENWPKSKKVRLAGISVSNLVKKSTEQLEMFAEKEKLRKLNVACDDIKNKYGHKIIFRGASLALGNEDRPMKKDHPVNRET